MIIVQNESSDSFPSQYKKRQWYQTLENIVRVLIDAWIPMDIAVILVDGTRMREVNRSYHGHDAVTDILSFYYEKDDSQDKAEGELYVCIAQLQRQAKRYSVSFQQEYARILTHGFLHLHGYDHIKPRERLIMNSLAAKILRTAKAKKLW